MQTPPLFCVFRTGAEAGRSMEFDKGRIPAEMSGFAEWRRSVKKTGSGTEKGAKKDTYDRPAEGMEKEKWVSKGAGSRMVFRFLLSAVLVLSGCAGGVFRARDGGADRTGTAGEGTAGSVRKGEAGAEFVSGRRLAGEQVVKTVYSEELSSWNYLLPDSASAWANYLDNLVEYDNYGLCRPCLAKSWTTSEDGLVWSFRIREGVAWQRWDGSFYGEEVRAEDWVTTARYILDPANAAQTADLLFVFRGAREYYSALAEGKPADFGTVGIRAAGEYELEFTLEKPLPYFLSLLQYNWGYPTSAEYLEEQGAGFGLDNRSILYCGAFLCGDYEPESRRIDYANTAYWDRKNIHIERIERRYNAEAGTLAGELFLRGEVTTAVVPAGQLDAWMEDAQRRNMLRPSRNTANSYFFLFNFRPAFPEKYNVPAWQLAVNSENFRKSIYYALDRTAAVQVYDPYHPKNFILRTITPKNFAAAGGMDYTETGALAAFTQNDPHDEAAALGYKAAAVRELSALGVNFPVQVYMPYNTGSAVQTNMAQVVEQQLERVLGTDYIDIVIEGYPDANYLNRTRRAGNYAFMLASWGPDFADPITYAEPFVIGQNYSCIYMADGMAIRVSEEEGGIPGADGGFWKDSVYDEMVQKAAGITDAAERYAALAEAEAWLLKHAFAVPLGTLSATTYIASNLNPFESQYAPFGASSSRYKYQYVYEEPFSAEEYTRLYKIWEEERAERIAAMQTGTD